MNKTQKSILISFLFTSAWFVWSAAHFSYGLKINLPNILESIIELPAGIIWAAGYSSGNGTMILAGLIFFFGTWIMSLIINQLYFRFFSK